MGEAGEWGNGNAEEVSSWEDFKTKFKERYWSESTQQKLKIRLLNPPVLTIRNNMGVSNSIFKNI